MTMKPCKGFLTLLCTLQVLDGITRILVTVQKEDVKCKSEFRLFSLFLMASGQRLGGNRGMQCNNPFTHVVYSIQILQMSR